MKTFIKVLGYSLVFFSISSAFAMGEDTVATTPGTISLKQVLDLPIEVSTNILQYYIHSSGSHYRQIIYPLLQQAYAANKTVCKGHTAGITFLSFDKSGQSFASASHDGTARVWDLKGHLQNTIVPEKSTAPNAVTQVIFNPLNNNELVVVSDRNYLQYWNLKTKNYVYNNTRFLDQAIQFMPFYIPDNHPYKGMAHKNATISKDGKLIVDTNIERLDIVVCHPAPNNPLLFLDDHHLQNAHQGKEITALALNPSGSLLASSGKNNTIKIWDTATGICWHSIKGNPSKDNLLEDDIVQSMVFDSKNLLYACSAQQAVKIYHIDHDKAVCVCAIDLPYPSDYDHTIRRGQPTALALSPDEKSLAIGFDNGQLHVINIEKFLALKKYLEEKATFNELIALSRLYLDNNPTENKELETFSTKKYVSEILQNKACVMYNDKTLDITKELFNLITWLSKQRPVHPDVERVKTMDPLKDVKPLYTVFGTLLFLGGQTLLNKMMQYFQ